MEKKTREIQKLLISLIKDSKKDTNLLSQMLDTITNYGDDKKK